MRLSILIAVMLFGGVCSGSQTPTPGAASSKPATNSTPPQQDSPAAPVVFQSEGGFTFSYPADWEVVDTKPMLPVARMQAGQNAKSALEQKGADCAQIQLMIRHGDPKSVILILYLEYACVGKSLNQSDLAATGMGISQGLTKNFEVPNPTYGAYKLGSHPFWIERGDGTLRNHPERSMMLETTCSMLKKGLVCWMGMAATPDAIATMESSKVSLEGEDLVTLVPESAFQSTKK